MSDRPRRAIAWVLDLTADITRAREVAYTGERARSADALREAMRLDVRLGRLLDRVARNPPRAALIAISIGLLAGGGLFSVVEPRASFFDGVWWAFISLTTVGYGDLAPRTTTVRMIAVLVICTGMAAVAILTAALAGRVAQRRIASMEPHEGDLGAVIDRLRADLAALEAAHAAGAKRDAGEASA